MTPDFEWCDGLAGRVVLLLPAEVVADCAHAGRCDDDVERWHAHAYLAEQFARYHRADFEYALREYGAWTLDELEATPRAILEQRILWCACCDCADSPDDYLIPTEDAEHAQ